MKNLLFSFPFIISLVLIQSCTSESFESKARKTTEAEIKNNIDNIDGFEFVAIEDPDTLTFNDFREQELLLLDIRYPLDADEERNIMILDSICRRILRYGPNYEASQQIKDGERRMIEIRAGKAQVDSLNLELKNPDSSQVMEYTMTYKFRAKNKSGNMELNKYYVRFDPEWKLISTSKTKD